MIRVSDADAEKAVLELISRVGNDRKYDGIIRGLKRDGQRGQVLRYMVGRRLLKEYAEDTGETGAIDWQKFHEWLNDHQAEINFMRMMLQIALLILAFV